MLHAYRFSNKWIYRAQKSRFWCDHEYDEPTITADDRPRFTLVSRPTNHRMPRTRTGWPSNRPVQWLGHRTVRLWEDHHHVSRHIHQLSIFRFYFVIARNWTAVFIHKIVQVDFWYVWFSFRFTKRNNIIGRFCLVGRKIPLNSWNY